MTWKQITSDHRQTLKDIVALIEHEAFERGFREGRRAAVESHTRLVEPQSNFIAHPDEGEWLLSTEPAGD